MIKFDEPTTWPTRWIDMCQIIAEDMEFQNRETGESTKWTASQVFNHHPTGELFQVHGWFIECVAAREAKARIASGEAPDGVFADLTRRMDAFYSAPKESSIKGPSLADPNPLEQNDATLRDKPEE